jgi:hypothetical protein
MYVIVHIYLPPSRKYSAILLQIVVFLWIYSSFNLTEVVNLRKEISVDFIHEIKKVKFVEYVV